jgi:VanZ like family
MTEQFPYAGGRRRTRIFCLVAVGAVLIATLWPFNPFPPNGVTWLPGTSGLQFEKAGLVVSRTPLRVGTETPSCSLELLLRPVSTKSLYTILTFYEPSRPRQFMVRQWTDGLLVTHDASVENNKPNTIKFDVDHVFHPGRLVLVGISSGLNGTTVYLDGQIARSFRNFNISCSELSGEIVLGTSPTAYDPWPGTLRGFAIYPKELTPADALRHYAQWTNPSGRPPEIENAIARYTFAEGAGHEAHNEVADEPQLEIPLTFSVPHKDLLRPATKEFRATWTYVSDVLINIAAFVPLGLIVCAYLVWTRTRWKRIIMTTTVCGVLSFGIEVMQYYVPRRVSGTTDIITNTLGAALGAALAEASLFRGVLLRMKLIPGAACGVSLDSRNEKHDVIHRGGL